MTIKLYTTTDPKNKLNKTLTEVATLTGTLKNNTDLINPVVDIEYSSFTFNYVYIQEFNRYYFVTSLKSMSNDLIRMELHVDVLKTYQSTIAGLSGYVTRNANTYDLDVVDPLQVISKGQDNVIYEFPNNPLMEEYDPEDEHTWYNFSLGTMGGI